MNEGGTKKREKGKEEMDTMLAGGMVWYGSQYVSYRGGKGGGRLDFRVRIM